MLAENSFVLIILFLPFFAGKKHHGALLPFSNGLQQHPLLSHSGCLIPMYPHSFLASGSMSH